MLPSINSYLPESFLANKTQDNCAFYSMKNDETNISQLQNFSHPSSSQYTNSTLSAGSGNYPSFNNSSIITHPQYHQQQSQSPSPPQPLHRHHQQQEQQHRQHRQQQIDEPYCYETYNYTQVNRHKWPSSFNSSISLLDTRRMGNIQPSCPPQYYSPPNSMRPNYENCSQHSNEWHEINRNVRTTNTQEVIQSSMDTNPQTRMYNTSCTDRNTTRNNSNMLSASIHGRPNELGYTKPINASYTSDHCISNEIPDKLKDGSIQNLLTCDNASRIANERDREKDMENYLQQQQHEQEHSGQSSYSPAAVAIPIDNILCSLPQSVEKPNDYDFDHTSNLSPSPQGSHPSSASFRNSTSPRSSSTFASSMANVSMSAGSLDGFSHSSSMSSLNCLYVPNRRGRKNMNFTKEEKRLRNRQAVRKCREKQATRRDYLENKIRFLESENEALRRSIQTGSRLFSGDPNLLAKGQHLDILTRLKMTLEEGTANDLVLSSKTIWETQAMLLLCLPCRSYTGHQMIEEFWKNVTIQPENLSRSKGISTTAFEESTEHSALFFSWIFQLSPKRRYRKFELNPVPNAKNLYIGIWETDTIPVLSGASYYLMGEHSRIQVQIESFGWLVWKLLLSETILPNTMPPAIS